jgi:hypothetical protein
MGLLSTLYLELQLQFTTMSRFSFSASESPAGMSFFRVLILKLSGG